LAWSPLRGRVAVVLAPDACDNRVSDPGVGRRIGRPDCVQAGDRGPKRAQHGPTAAAREKVAKNPPARAWLQPSLGIVRQELARLRAGGDEPIYKCELHPGHSQLRCVVGAVRCTVERVTGQEETALLTQAQAGDIAAFERFVLLFERRVRGLLSRLLTDERDIEEAAQDTFVQAWRNLERFRGDAAPFTWLYRIAVNEALQRARRRRPETQSIDEELLDVLEYQHGAAASRPRPTELTIEDRETQALLLDRVRRLPFELRTPLVLRDLEGWSNQEVADILDLSLPATKSRIHRARMKLREELEQWLRRGES
jgi:RNA polymerase sigma-70 factor (ECF subfamily)